MSFVFETSEEFTPVYNGIKFSHNPANGFKLFPEEVFNKHIKGVEFSSKRKIVDTVTKLPEIKAKATLSKRKVEFWTWRGYTEKEALEKIGGKKFNTPKEVAEYFNKVQKPSNPFKSIPQDFFDKEFKDVVFSNNAKFLKTMKKLTKNKYSNYNIKYWLLRGYTEDEANAQISNAKKPGYLTFKTPEELVEYLNKEYYQKNPFKSITQEFFDTFIKDKSFKKLELYELIKREITSKASGSFDINFWLIRGYNASEAKDQVFNIQSNNANKFHTKRRNGEYNEEEMWKNCGGYFPSQKEHWMKYYDMTEAEAKECVSDWQGYQSRKLNNKRKQNPEAYKDILETQWRYWVKKGYTEDEAKEKVKARQDTSSIPALMAAHNISEEEAIKLQNEHIMKRVTHPNFNYNYFLKNRDLKKVGYLYYIKINLPEKPVYKIGITTHSDITKRFNFEYPIDIGFMKEMTLGEAFDKEQKFLDKLKNHRSIVNEYGFKSTECFYEDVLNVF